MVLERSVGQHARTEQISEQTRFSRVFEIFMRLRSSARQYDWSSSTGQEKTDSTGVKTRVEQRLRARDQAVCRKALQRARVTLTTCSPRYSSLRHRFSQKESR